MLTVFTRLLRRGTEWAFERPLVAGLLTGVITGIVFLPIPQAAGEDATRLEQAFGIGIGAFLCTSILWWWFGVQNERFYGPNGADARARAARREDELAALSRHDIALRLFRRAIMSTVIFGIVARLVITESATASVVVGCAFGVFTVAVEAWGIWSARNMPVFTLNSEE